SHEQVSPQDLSANNDRYVGVVEAMWAKQPAEARHQSHGFYHFNSRLGRRITNRIYISARLSGAPDYVVGAWQRALHETALQYRTYFKVPVRLSRRFETIVLYQTVKTDDAEMAALLATFAKKCPTNLL